MLSTAGFQAGGHIQALDGLRGIAILSVLFVHVPVHALGRFFTLGWAGVDLFFVLSGFLITGILMDQKGSDRYFRTFYVRRILKIWPVYYGLLVVIFFIGPAIYPAAGQYVIPPLSYFLLFIQNLFLDLQGRGPLTLTWSLAIEEQFYLLWPFVVAVMPARLLKILLIALFCAPPVLRYVVALFNESSFIYYHTLFRMDGLVAGSLIALWLRSEERTQQQVLRGGQRAAAAGLAGSVFLWLLMGERFYRGALTYSFLAILFAGMLLVALGAKPTSRYKAWLEARWLRYTGKISYGMYMTHLFVFLAFRTQASKEFFLAFPNVYLAELSLIVVAFALAYGLASLSWLLFEKPILSLKKHFPYARKVDAGRRQILTRASGR